MFRCLGIKVDISIRMQQPVKMTLAHNSPPPSPKGMGATKFAELVSAKSGGRITINVAPSEQLGNENTNMAALRTGTLDFGSIGQGNARVFFCCVRNCKTFKFS